MESCLDGIGHCRRTPLNPQRMEIDSKAMIDRSILRLRLKRPYSATQLKPVKPEINRFSPLAHSLQARRALKLVNTEGRDTNVRGRSNLASGRKPETVQLCKPVAGSEERSGLTICFNSVAKSPIASRAISQLMICSVNPTLVDCLSLPTIFV